MALSCLTSLASVRHDVELEADAAVVDQLDHRPVLRYTRFIAFQEQELLSGICAEEYERRCGPGRADCNIGILCRNVQTRDGAEHVPEPLPNEKRQGFLTLPRRLVP